MSKRIPANVVTLLIGFFIGMQVQVVADSGRQILSSVLVKGIAGAGSYVLVHGFLLRGDDAWCSFRKSIAVGIFGSIAFALSASAFDFYSDYLSHHQHGILNVTELGAFWFQAFVLRLVVVVPITSVVFMILYNCIRLLGQFFRRGIR
ncbi:MAG: hypothetical protein KF831_03275 [Acidobacteria bacterium]|nr:hypothetical protein [Acidobacteriota bacterium]